MYQGRIGNDMRNDCDAYGHELYDFYLGKDVGEIVERDDGYIESSGGPQAYFAEYKDWHSYEKKAIRYARGCVLDIGCGAGRHSVYLQNKGHDVLGIDVSPLALKVCKSRGLKRTRNTSITRISAQLGTFDTILMLGNNFGLFGGFKRARWLLKRFHNMTSDDARIIAASLDPYDTNEPLHLAYHRRNRKKGRMGGQLRIRVRYQTYATPWFDYLIVSRPEMRRILEGTGWHLAHVCESGGPIYIAIIEKTHF